MKKLVLIICAAGLFLSGCVSYKAAGLVALEPKYIKEMKGAKGLSAGCKALNPTECKIYLGRNVLTSGFQPLQLTFNNSGTTPYLFDIENLGLKTVPPHVVAETAHTSTAGRAIGWTAASVLFAPVLAAFGAHDTQASYVANKKLNADYHIKGCQVFLIEPGTSVNTVVFVKAKDFCPMFKLNLIDQNTGKSQELTLTAAG